MTAHVKLACSTNLECKSDSAIYRKAEKSKDALGTLSKAPLSPYVSIAQKKREEKTRGLGRILRGEEKTLDTSILGSSLTNPNAARSK